MDTFFDLLALAGVVAGMILLYLKVLPKKLDGTFSNKLLQFLHDYFNFKKLYVESVLKFIFALATVACIVVAVVGFVATICNFFVGLVDAMDWGSHYFDLVLENTLTGIVASVVLLVAGPVVLRLAYEFCMMFILLVKNVMEINNKTKDESAKEEAPAVDQAPEAPAVEQAPEAPANE